MVFNGKPTIEWLSKEDTSSATASLEPILNEKNMHMTDKISWFWMFQAHSLR